MVIALKRREYIFHCTVLKGKFVVGMKKLVKAHVTSIGMLGLLLMVSACSQKVSPVASADKPITTPVPASDSIIKPVLVRNTEVVIDTLLYPFRFQAPSQWSNHTRDYSIHQKTKRFYERTDLKTRWLGTRCPNSFYFNFIDILKHANLYGLNVSDYAIEEIEQQVATVYSTGAPLSREITTLDIALTRLYFLFTTHLSTGRINNPAFGKNVWIRYPVTESDKDVMMLVETSSADDLALKLEELQPNNVQYSRLRKALNAYRDLAQASAPVLSGTAVPAKIKPGEKHPVIALIRKKLLLTDLAPYVLPIDTLTGQADSTRYDEYLVEGVKKFQSRHGLTADGIVGERTLRFLDQSLKSKADVIAVNLERLRWMPKMEDDHYIEVNIPEYMLRIYNRQKLDMTMKVIVGAINKPTPVFSELLEHLIFSPTWTVPTSIIKEEIIPRLQQNPAYYSGKNYQFFRNNLEIDPSAENWNEEVNPYAYRIVQMPGDDNSLGRVKFVMPNAMNVYLHDTPNHRLFSKDYRALSHGCIRLSDPAAFAAYLLRDQRGWETSRINKAMNEATPTVVHLKTLYKVYTSYRTAWVDDDGVVNFREDIYGYDQYQIQLISPQKQEKRYADRSEVNTPPVESL
jgi:L,D-transpeptidase YcbB